MSTRREPCSEPRPNRSQRWRVPYARRMFTREHRATPSRPIRPRHATATLPNRPLSRPHRNPDRARFAYALRPHAVPLRKLGREPRRERVTARGSSPWRRGTIAACRQRPRARRRAFRGDSIAGPRSTPTPPAPTRVTARILRMQCDVRCRTPNLATLFERAVLLVSDIWRDRRFHHNPGLLGSPEGDLHDFRRWQPACSLNAGVQRSARVDRRDCSAAQAVRPKIRMTARVGSIRERPCALGGQR
jgi:hypothetical protein